MTTTSACRDCGGLLTQAFTTTTNYDRCTRCGHVFPAEPAEVCPGCDFPVSMQEALTGRCAKDGQLLERPDRGSK